MASILPFVPRGVFDDAATKAVGEAFDAACKALHPTGKPEKVLQNAIARRIVAAARKGERDENRLLNAALAGLRESRRAVEKTNGDRPSRQLCFDDLAKGGPLSTCRLFIEDFWTASSVAHDT